MNQKTLVGLVAVVALIVGVVGAIYIAPPTPDNAASAPQTQPDTDYFSYYPAPRALSEFMLTAHTGEPVNNETLKNQWTLIFLGYTFCPDICPTTMAELNRIYP